MCLIVLAWRTHPRYRLIVAANRDEYFGRPTAPATFWDDHPGVLAGRDLEAGGTWLGITPQGRFAALTNYRNPADQKTGAPSRGALVSDFLTGNTGPGEYVREIEKHARDYNGFSLLAGDAASMYFFSNRGGHPARVEPGVHGLSNHLLDTPWPKVEKGKAAFSALLDKPFDAEAALHLLDDTQRASDELLPSTGVSLELEERLSAIRIPAVGGYGTRCSTVLSFAEDGKVEFHERSYREDGGASGTVSYRFTVPPGKDRASSRRAQSLPPKTPLPVR
ncbi:MAG TPA: NRDE family protein [Burkholderiales bacterium]|nr:NRDE family protein [Burkholderiales bacterium]